MYRHVSILRRAGLDASIVHKATGFRPQWFIPDVPILYADRQLPVRRGDWLVLPEDHPDMLRAVKGIPLPKVVFCQNHFYVFDALEPTVSWQDFGVTEAMTVSHQAKAFIGDVFGIDATYVPNAIDPAAFPPARWHEQPLAVAYMPRKGLWNIKQVRGMLCHRAPALASVPWKPIEGVTESQVAATLRNCRVFVSTGFHEGFGLPPLEAMASGCLVAGYKAGGGLDFATGENGIWIADEDTLALADAVQKLLTDLIAEPDDERWVRMREAGFASARAYDPARQESAVLEFWRPRIG